MSTVPAIYDVMYAPPSVPWGDRRPARKLCSLTAVTDDGPELLAALAAVAGQRGDGGTYTAVAREGGRKVVAMQVTWEEDPDA